MLLFWYQSERILPDGWTKVFLQTEKHSQKFRAQIKIIGYSHQINLYFKDRQLCEALISRKPSVKVEEFLLLNLTNNNQYLQTDLHIWISTNLAEVNNFLKKTDVIKYDFGSGAWTAVQLTETQNSLWVHTLHCYPELDSVVWSQTRYHL